MSRPTARSRASPRASGPRWSTPKRFCTDSASIDDDLIERLRLHLADDEIVELTLVIGKYLSMGRFMQVLGLDQTCSLQFDDDSGRVVAH